MKFLKNFALGLLWAFLSPLLLAILALFAVFALGVYSIECFKCLIRFFQGKSFFPPLEEDLLVKKIQAKELKELIGETTEEKKEEVPAAPQPQQVYVQQNFYTSTPGMPFPGMGAPMPGAVPFVGVSPTPIAAPQNPGQAAAPAADKVPVPDLASGGTSVPPPPTIDYRDLTPSDEKKEGGNE